MIQILRVFFLNRMLMCSCGFFSLLGLCGVSGLILLSVLSQGNCKMSHIPGFTYPVQELYLEEIIEKTG